MDNKLDTEKIKVFKGKEIGVCKNCSLCIPSFESEIVKNKYRSVVVCFACGSRGEWKEGDNEEKSKLEAIDSWNEKQREEDGNEV